MGFGEVGERGDLLSSVAQQFGDGRELRLEHAGDNLDMFTDAGPGGLGEDGADGGGDHVGVALGHFREGVAHEVHPAALPRSTLRRRR